MAEAVGQQWIQTSLGVWKGDWGLDLSGFLLSQLSHHKITLLQMLFLVLIMQGFYRPPTKWVKKTI